MPSQGEGLCCSPVPPGSWRARLRAAPASLRHSPTQHEGKAHTRVTKPCHLCLTTEVQIDDPFGKAGLKSPCQTCLSFQKTRYMTSCSQLSESRFRTCVSSFCCSEEVTTSNRFHLLKGQHRSPWRISPASLPCKHCSPSHGLQPFAPHCKARQEVQEANAVACTSRQHALRNW